MQTAGRSAKVDASFIDIVEKCDTLVGPMVNSEARNGPLDRYGGLVWSSVGFERNDVRTRPRPRPQHPDGSAEIGAGCQGRPYGRLMVSTRAVADAANAAHFRMMSAVSTLSGGLVITSTARAIIADKEGQFCGAVGISGDLGESDET